MRFSAIVESQRTLLELTDSEARSLNALGRSLASSSTYWRSNEVAAGEERGIIDCVSDGTSWSIFVRGAVGLLRVGNHQINVLPKIPVTHLVYLLGLSNLLPRLTSDVAQASKDTSLLELIAYWFLRELEMLLRRGIVKDYSESTDELESVRGQVDALYTAEQFYSGRLRFQCRFDEFSHDTALHRLLRAAAGRVAGQRDFGTPLRRRAMGALAHFGDVSTFQYRDMVAQVERRTAHYSDAVKLAKLLLGCEARTVESGGESAWSFLIPTAAPVENGIRLLLAQSLEGYVTVTNRGKRLRPSSLTVNPDLVFEPSAGIGDVKYKDYGSEWNRGDLYQSVAFAQAYSVSRGVVISFGDRERHNLPQLVIGDNTITHLIWPTDVDEPRDAAGYLTDSVRGWLQSAPASQAVA